MNEDLKIPTSLFFSVKDLVSLLGKGAQAAITSPYFGPISVGSSAALVAFLVIKKAIKNYKKFSSEARIFCSDEKGINRKVCMLQYELSSRLVQLKTLERGLEQCKKSIKPEKCEEKINEEIERVTTEIQEIQNKLEELR